MIAESREPFEPPRRLTRAQFRIVALMWHSELNYECIARQLNISIRTVKNQVERVANWLPGHGPASWKVLRHAETLLEAGHSDRDEADADAA